ncbi:MAG: GNAT family N-acetyltransferase [Clostridiales Family XIII bacterium]|jgi:N-acetylglutamate synthase-like GNAT family acetyltransferase|nr:GNAT family N-acetyltransferase [Clostridiales Family XIII bacterium]
MVDRTAGVDREVARACSPLAGAVTISETDAYGALVAMFVKNGLEFSEEEAERAKHTIPADIVKCYEAVEMFAGCDGASDSADGNARAGRLIGGCVLAVREGSFIIDGIAAEPEYREIKLGKKMLEMAVNEAKSRGANELFLVARAPDFFRKQGFVAVSREDAPNFFECFTCPQYNTSCFPEVMRLRWR